MYSSLRLVLRRSASSLQSLRKRSKLPSEAVVITSERETILAWHPEPEFPYEHSLPVPQALDCTDSSALRIGRKEVTEVFWKKSNDQIVEELSKMTYTTKHRWYPRSRDKKAKKTEPDRPYL